MQQAETDTEPSGAAEAAPTKQPWVTPDFSRIDLSSARGLTNIQGDSLQA